MLALTFPNCQTSGWVLPSGVDLLGFQALEMPQRGMCVQFLAV